MIVHVLTFTDTLQSIAYRYFGDYEMWRRIVEYNGLDYPYFTKDPNFETTRKASGDVLFTLPSEVEEEVFIIPKNTIVSDDERVRRYRTTQKGIIAIGSDVTRVPVISEVEGDLGNIAAYKINTVVTTEFFEGVVPSVLNTQPFINGRVLKVLFVGDNLFIPIEEHDDSNRDNLISLYARNDFGFSDDNDLDIDEKGDIKVVNYINKVKQRVEHRIHTLKGELYRHADFGSNVGVLVGRNEPFIENLIRMDIMENLSGEFFIDNVEVVDVVKKGTKIRASINLQLKAYDDVVNFIMEV